MDANEKNLAHVAELMAKAKAAGLEGLGWLESLGVKRCCEGYNGIGPEFLPVAVRDKVTDWLGLFEPAALVHDMRNDVADGTWTGFLHANKEFRANCLKLADAAYPWYSWRRYRARAVAVALFEFVSAENFGWRAWLEAHERYLARKNNLATKDTKDTEP